MWKERFADKFPSASEAGRRLHVALKKRVPKEAARNKPTSLSSRISALLNGDSRWWLGDERAVYRTLFAQLLDLDVDDVFGAPAQEAGGLSFPEFPGLPALLLKDEPCRVSESGWLLHDAVGGLRGDRGPARRWVCARPGSGKSLTIRYLAARHGSDFVAVSVATLEDALAYANARLPLVVEIEERHVRSDERAMRQLERRAAPTVVLAPFPIPEPAWSVPGASIGASASGWATRNASLAADWRDRMLQWLDRRLDDSDRDTRLEVGDVRSWLDARDPHGDLVPSPGDLIALCATFDIAGSEDVTVSARARRWITQIAPTMIPRDAPATWRRRGSSATWEGSVVAHLKTLNARYGSLSRADWEPLIPERLTSDSGLGPGRTMAVGHLVDGGLLRAGEHGMEAFPTWVALGVCTDSIASMFDARDLRWGAFAADESRRPVIDAALDALPLSSLLGLAKRCAGYEGPQTLASVGAIEATIAAVARRVAGSKRIPEHGVASVQDLMLRQVASLVREENYREVHHPLTRPDVDEWFATAWTISLAVRPPAAHIAHDLAWELPGWAGSLSLDALPHHRFPSTELVGNPSADAPLPGMIITSPGTRVISDDVRVGLTGTANRHVRRVAQLARAVEPLLRVAPLPSNTPRILLPALLLSERAWAVSPAQYMDLERTWEEAFLATEASALPLVHRQALAGRLWSELACLVVPDGAVPVAERVETLLRAFPSLAGFVLSHVSADDVRRTAEHHGTHRRPVGTNSFRPSNPRLLLGLPDETRRGAILSWLDGAAARGSRFDEARELTPLLGLDDMELALALVRKADRDVAAEFTSYVWTTAPEQARDEARRAVAEGLASAPSWFHLAPRRELAFLAALVAELNPRPAWVSEWSRRRVLEGGNAAESLYALRGE